MKSLTAIAFTLLLASCAIAPFNTATTARSLGKDKIEISGSILPILGLKIERGLTDRLDIGAGFELQADTLFFLHSKFAFINNEKNGFSLAALSGGSLASGYSRARSIFGGPLVSYRWETFELFFGARFNYTQWNYFDFLRKDPGALDRLIALPSTENHFTYWQFDPGMSFVGEQVMTGTGLHLLKYKDHLLGVPYLHFGFKF